MIYVVIQGERNDAELIGYSESFDEATTFARDRSRAAYVEREARWEQQRSGPHGHLVPRHTAPFDEEEDDAWDFYVIEIEHVKAVREIAEQEHS